MNCKLLVMYMLYKQLGKYNIYDLLHCCNMDLDICYNILMLVSKQMLVKHIILHIRCYNLQRKSELIDLLLQGIIGHNIWIFYQHMNLEDMFLHIVLYCYQQKVVELMDSHKRRIL